MSPPLAVTRSLASTPAVANGSRAGCLSPLAATQAPAVIDAATTRYPAGCLSPLAVTSNLFLTEPVVHQFRGTPFEPDLRQAIGKLGEMLPDGASQTPGFCVFADLRTARS